MNYEYDDEDMADMAAGYTPEEVGRRKLGRAFKRFAQGMGRAAIPGAFLGRGRGPGVPYAAQRPPESHRSTPQTLGRVIQPGNQRIRQLGLPPLILAAGAAGVTQATVLKAIQPQRLTVGVSGVAIGEITIDQIRINTDSQLAGVDPLPATLFQPDAIGVGVMWNPVGVGGVITVNATNLGNGIATVLFGFTGVAAD